MNSYKHIFLAEAGSNSAREFLHKALHSSDFPKKFRPLALNLQKRVVALDQTLERFSDQARSDLRSKSARDYALTKETSAKSLIWAAQGLSNALSELRLWVKQDPTKDYLVRETQLLFYEVDYLAQEVREYQNSLHPLDWAEELYGEFSKKLPSFSGFRGRPALIASSGKHTLPPLPYAYDALEPIISEETLREHHDKHHKGYVDGLNRAELEISEAQDEGDFEDIPPLNALLEFNAGGHYLHSLYWPSLTPPSNYRNPSDFLRGAVEKDFGSWEVFREQFKEVFFRVRGSGWAVLVWTPSGLRIVTVMNHENGVLWNSKVLLPLDAWEHAYYLDYKSNRSSHFDSVFDNLVCWAEVENRLQQALTLEYPMSLRSAFLRVASKDSSFRKDLLTLSKQAGLDISTQLVEDADPASKDQNLPESYYGLPPKSVQAAAREVEYKIGDRVQFRGKGDLGVIVKVTPSLLGIEYKVKRDKDGMVLTRAHHDLIDRT